MEKKRDVENLLSANVYNSQMFAVLEVTVPRTGETAPMHHHYWPSFFLDWDMGGRWPHIRYHQPGNIVRDSPSIDSPVHPGHRSVPWMKPEPMHAIETVEKFDQVHDIPLLRVKIKIHGQ